MQAETTPDKILITHREIKPSSAPHYSCGDDLIAADIREGRHPGYWTAVRSRARGPNVIGGARYPSAEGAASHLAETYREEYAIRYECEHAPCGGACLPKVEE